MTQTRRRLSREERYRQLVETAWQLIGEEGTEALTLGRLAERSGVTKPVVYDHFETRLGLLAAAECAQGAGAPHVRTHFG